MSATNKKLINIVKGDIESAIQQGTYVRDTEYHSNIEFDTKNKRILLDGEEYTNSLNTKNIDILQSNVSAMLDMLKTLDDNLANIAFTGNRPTLFYEIDISQVIDCTVLGDLFAIPGKDWTGKLTPNTGMELPSEIDITGDYDGYEYDSTTGDLTIEGVNSNLELAVTALLYIPYIREGLVFWLDGINKGPNADAWTDLIGGVVFPNHGYNNNSEYSAYKAVSNTDNWGTSNFGGNYTNTGSWLGVAGTSNDLVFDRSTSTIEGVYKGVSGGGDDGAFNVCHLARQASSSFNGIYMSVNGGGYINGVYIGNTLNVWSNVVNGKNLSDSNKPHTISMNKTRAINNGMALNSLGANHWAGNGGGRFINCSATYNFTTGKPQFFSKGNIYSIRIYNRILTEEEMLHNLRVDNERFNLGITTIPEEVQS